MSKKGNRGGRNNGSQNKNNKSSKKNKKPQAADNGLVSAPDSSLAMAVVEKKSPDEGFEVLDSQNSSRNPSKDNSSSDLTPRAASPSPENQQNTPDSSKEPKSTPVSSLQDSWQEIPFEDSRPLSSDLPVSDKTKLSSERDASNADSALLPSISLQSHDEQSALLNTAEQSSSLDKTPRSTQEALYIHSISQGQPMPTTPHSVLEKYDDDVMITMSGYLFSTEAPTEPQVVNLPPGFMQSSDDQVESESNTSPVEETNSMALDAQDKDHVEPIAKEDSGEAKPAIIAESAIDDARSNESDESKPHSAAIENPAMENINVNSSNHVLPKEADLLKDRNTAPAADLEESNFTSNMGLEDDIITSANEATSIVFMSEVPKKVELSNMIETDAKISGLEHPDDAFAKDMGAFSAKDKTDIKAQEAPTDLSEAFIREESSENISHVSNQDPVGASEVKSSFAYPAPEVSTGIEAAVKDKSQIPASDKPEDNLSAHPSKFSVPDLASHGDFSYAPEAQKFDVAINQDTSQNSQATLDAHTETAHNNEEGPTASVFESADENLGEETPRPSNMSDVSSSSYSDDQPIPDKNLLKGTHMPKVLFDSEEQGHPIAEELLPQKSDAELISSPRLDDSKPVSHSGSELLEFPVNPTSVSGISGDKIDIADGDSKSTNEAGTSDFPPASSARSEDTIQESQTDDISPVTPERTDQILSGSNPATTVAWKEPASDGDTNLQKDAITLPDLPGKGALQSLAETEPVTNVADTELVPSDNIDVQTDDMALPDASERDIQGPSDSKTATSVVDKEPVPADNTDVQANVIQPSDASENYDQEPKTTEPEVILADIKPISTENIGPQADAISLPSISKKVALQVLSTPDPRSFVAEKEPVLADVKGSQPDDILTTSISEKDSLQYSVDFEIVPIPTDNQLDSAGKAELQKVNSSLQGEPEMEAPQSLTNAELADKTYDKELVPSDNIELQVDDMALPDASERDIQGPSDSKTATSVVDKEPVPADNTDVQANVIQPSDASENYDQEPKTTEPIVTVVGIASISAGSVVPQPDAIPLPSTSEKVALQVLSTPDPRSFVAEEEPALPDNLDLHTLVHLPTSERIGLLPSRDSLSEAQNVPIGQILNPDEPADLKPTEPVIIEGLAFKSSEDEHASPLDSVDQDTEDEKDQAIEPKLTKKMQPIHDEHLFKEPEIMLQPKIDEAQPASDSLALGSQLHSNNQMMFDEAVQPSKPKAEEESTVAAALNEALPNLPKNVVDPDTIIPPVTLEKDPLQEELTLDPSVIEDKQTLPNEEIGQQDSAQLDEYIINESTVSKSDVPESEKLIKQPQSLPLKNVDEGPIPALKDTESVQPHQSLPAFAKKVIPEKDYIIVEAQEQAILNPAMADSNPKQNLEECHNIKPSEPADNVTRLGSGQSTPKDVEYLPPLDYNLTSFTTTDDASFNETSIPLDPEDHPSNPQDRLAVEEFYQSKLALWCKAVGKVGGEVYWYTAQALATEQLLAKNDNKLVLLMNRLSEIPLVYAATEKLLGWVENELTRQENYIDQLSAKFAAPQAQRASDASQEEFKLYCASVGDLAKVSQALSLLQSQVLSFAELGPVRFQNPATLASEEQALLELGSSLDTLTSMLMRSLISPRYAHRTTLGWGFDTDKADQN